MIYCANCGKPCDKSHPSAIQSLEKGTDYLCAKCADRQRETTGQVFRYIILPIAAVLGVLYGIGWVVRELVPSVCGKLGIVGPVVSNIQGCVGLTLGLTVLIIGLKIVLKPWRRLKWYWQLLIVIVIWPAIVLPIAQFAFWGVGCIWNVIRGKK